MNNVQENHELENVEESEVYSEKLNALTNEERKVIHQILLQKESVNGALKRGVKRMVAETFSESEKTI